YKDDAERCHWRLPDGDSSIHQPPWARFIDEDRVLARANSSPNLSLWRVPAGVAVYAESVEGGTVMDLTPDRKYAMVLHWSGVFFHDVRTGKPCGELRTPLAMQDFHPMLAGDRVSLAVSPDRTRLMAQMPGTRTLTPLVYWDLKSGECLGHVLVAGTGRTLCWLDSNLALACDEGISATEFLVVDLDRRIVAWRWSVDRVCNLDTHPCKGAWAVCDPPGEDMKYLVKLRVPVDSVREEIGRSMPEGARIAWGPEARVGIDVSGLALPANCEGLRESIEKRWRECIEAIGARVVESSPVKLVLECRQGETTQSEYRTVGRWGSDFSITVTQWHYRVAVVADGLALWEHKGMVDSDPRAMLMPVSGDEDPVAVLHRQGEEQVRRGLEAAFVKTFPPDRLHLQPSNSGGQLGLGSTEMALEDLIVLPENPDLTGLVDSSRPERPVGGFGPRHGGDVGPVFGPRDASDSQRRFMINLLGGPDETLLRHLRWFPAGRRPTVFLRFGGAVDFNDGSLVAQIDNPFELRRLVGEVGLYLNDKLKERLANDEYGSLPDGVDRRLREPAMLGAGKEETLVDDARRQGFDVLLLVEIDQRAAGRGLPDKVRMRFHFVDPCNGARLFSSHALYSSAKPGTKGADAMGMAGNMLNYADENLRLQPMPPMNAEIAKSRLASLSSMIEEAERRRDKGAFLRIMLELRYYQVMEFVVADDVEPLYAKILGPEQAHFMVEDEIADRQRVLREWLDGK
ncbi:MAG TPA: hypothetical protein DD670_07670, partial [Planctomycetaceae bacterium]|nr:hypothetical protein [Planctomycetaceae bacterium]